MKQAIYQIGLGWVLMAAGLAEEKGQPSGDSVTEKGRAIDDVDFVKRFRMEAKFTQVIGSFSLFVPPQANSEFEIDLAKLPLDKIRFTLDKAGSASALTHGEFPIQPALKLERVEQNQFTTTIFLSSEGKASRTRVQITGNSPLANGSEVYLYICGEDMGRITGMGGARGTLKEKPSGEK